MRAGLAILDAMKPVNARLNAGGGTALAVRVGMHTGPAVIADGGEVFGETANLAARVQSAADPDTVVVTGATQRLVPGIFVLEDRGPHALKGIREPVPLYRVVQPSGVRSRLAVAEGRLTPFVGREMELATLVERWGRAADGPVDDRLREERVRQAERFREPPRERHGLTSMWCDGSLDQAAANNRHSPSTPLSA